MNHDIRIASGFRSALGGEAYVVEAYPNQSTDNSPVYFHGGHGVNPEKYIRYIAEAHNRHAFSLFYPKRRSRDNIYWLKEGNT